VQALYDKLEKIRGETAAGGEWPSYEHLRHYEAVIVRYEDLRQELTDQIFHKQQEPLASKRLEKYRRYGYYVARKDAMLKKQMLNMINCGDDRFRDANCGERATIRVVDRHRESAGSRGWSGYTNLSIIGIITTVEALGWSPETALPQLAGGRLTLRTQSIGIEGTLRC
jgi:hypothetical protein